MYFLSIDIVPPPRNRNGVPHEFTVHKAIVLPHSPFLRDLVDQHTMDPTISSTRETAKIFFDVETELMDCILRLVYTGSLKASSSELRRVASGLDSMGIDSRSLRFDLQLRRDNSQRSQQRMLHLCNRPVKAVTPLSQSNNVSVTTHNSTAYSHNGLKNKRPKKFYSIFKDPSEIVNPVKVNDEDRQVTVLTPSNVTPPSNVTNVIFPSKPRPNLQCPKCATGLTSKALLLKHLAFKHYGQKIKALNRNGQCFKCDKVLAGDYTILKHVAVHHPQAIKACLTQEGLRLPTAPMKEKPPGHLQASDFPCKALRVDVKKIKVDSLKECFLCHEQLPPGRVSVLRHFLRDDQHYRLEMKREFCKPTSTWALQEICPECGLRIPCESEILEHLSLAHNYLLNFIPARFRIPPLTEDSAIVLPRQTPHLGCPVAGCATLRPDAMSLNVHIIMTHLRQTLERKYKKAMRTGPVACPACTCKMEFAASSQAEDRLNLYKHMFTHPEIRQDLLDQLDNIC